MTLAPGAAAAELTTDLPGSGCREGTEGMEEMAGMGEETAEEVVIQEPCQEEPCQEEPYQEGRLVVDSKLGASVTF